MSMLYKTDWSGEWKAWSQRYIDTLTNSPHYFYKKHVGTTKENLSEDMTDIKVQIRVKTNSISALRLLLSVRRREIPRRLE